MSEVHARKQSRSSSSFWRVYMFSWAALAAGALGYLGTLAINPDGRSRLINPLQSDQESNRAELDRAQLTAQVRSLRDTVATLRDDIARLSDQRTRTATLRSSEQTLPPVVPVATENARNDANAGNEPATSEMFPETSNVKTGSIPAPTTTTEPTAASEPPQSSPNSPPTAAVKPSIINQPSPPANAAPAPATSTPAPSQVAVAKPAPPATTEAARPKRNLAISPLRSGRVPPVPGHLPRQAAAPDEGISAAPGNGPYQPILLNNGTRSSTAPQARQAVRTASAAPKPLTQRAVRTVPVTQPRSPAAPSSANPFPTPPRTNAKPVAFGTPTVTARRPPPRRSPAALSLSSATSITGLRASWLLLTTSHASTLSGYQPRFVKNSSNNNYRLIAGPIASRFEADRVCTSLRIQGVSCGVTNFGGTPF